MATELGVGYLSIVPETSKIAPGIGKALGGTEAQGRAAGKRAGAAMGLSMGSALKGAVKLAGIAGVGYAVGREIGASFRSGIDSQNTEASLKGLYGSAEDAADMMRRIGQVSRTSPIDTSTYDAAATSLAYLGVKGQQSQDILRNVGLAITAAGGDSEQLQRATDALTRMVNEGRVTRETLNQLSQAGVPVFTALADSMGVTNEQLTDMITKGGVELPDVLKVLENGTGELFQQMITGGKEAEKTLGNTLKSTKSAIEDAIGGAIVPALDSLTPLLRTIGQKAPAVIGAFGEKLQELGESARSAFAEFQDSGADRMMLQLKGAWSSLVDLGSDLAPIVASLGRSLAKASAAVGVSTWKVLLATVDATAQILDATLVPVLRTVADLMEKNEGAVKALAVGFAVFKTVPRIMGRILPPLRQASAGVTSFAGAMRDTYRWAGQADPQIGAVGRSMRVLRGNGVNAARAMGKLKSAARGVVGALGGITGIGIMGVTALLAGNASSASSAKAAQDALAKSVADGARAQDELYNSLGRTNGALDDQSIAAASRVVKGQLADVVELGKRGHSSMENLGRAIDSVTGNVFGLNDEWEDQYDNVSAMEGQYNALKSVMGEMKIDLDDVYRIAAEGGPKFDELTSKLAAAGGNGKKVAQQLRDARDSIQDFQDTAKLVGPTAVEVAAGFKKIADEAATADEKSSALKHTLDAIAGDSISLFEAESQVADAQQKIAESAGQARDATQGYGDELLTADGRLKGSTKNGKEFGEAILSARDSLADFVTAGGDLNDKLPQIMSGLYDWGASLGLTKEQVDGVAHAMGLVPDELQIAASVQGGGDVIGELGGIAGQIAALKPGEPKTVKVNALTDAAKTRLEALGFGVKELEDHPGVFTVTAKTDAAQNRLVGVLGLVNRIPDGKRIDTSAPGAQGVIDAFDTIGIQVHSDNNKNIVVDDNSAQTIAALEALNIKTTTLDDGTVVITDNVPTVKGRLNGLNGYDTSSDHTINVHSVFDANTRWIRNQGPSVNLPFVGGGFADGGVLPEQATIAAGRGRGLVQWAESETGGEAFIPLAASKRARSTDILADVAARFGYGLAKYADGGISDSRMANAAAIIAEGRSRGLDAKAIKIALAAALVESNLTMFANPADPASMNMPHDAVGSDHDSVGLFQQRANGAWGTTADRMAPRRSAGMFYDELVKLDYENMAPGAAAQAVQRSAFPGRYATRMAEAGRILDRLGDEVAAGDADRASMMDTLDAMAKGTAEWTEQDEQRLRKARQRLDDARDKRDGLAEDASDEVRRHADLQVARADRDVTSLESKKQSKTGVEAMTTPAAPALSGGMGDDAIRLRQAELAVTDAQLARDKTYADASATAADREKADLQVYSAQNALKDAREQAVESGGGPGGASSVSGGSGIKGILQGFASKAAGIAYDSVWKILGIDEPRWLSMDIPAPESPGGPAPDLLSALFPDADINSLPAPLGDVRKWLADHGVPLHDDGGWFEPGLAANLTGRPEPILSPEQLDWLRGAADAGAGGATERVTHNTYYVGSAQEVEQIKRRDRMRQMIQSTEV